MIVIDFVELLGEIKKLDIIFYAIALKSLGNLLEKVKAHPDIINHDELHEIMTKAVAFYTDIDIEFLDFLAERDQLLTELSELRQQNVEHKTGSLQYNAVLEFYQSIAESGGDAELVCKVALANDIETINIIKIMRTLFGLSLEDAKAIYDTYKQS